MEKCENCGGIIGDLETPFVSKGHVVCASCYGRLEPIPAPSINRQNVTATTDAVAGRVILIIIAAIVALVGVAALLSDLTHIF